MATAPDVRVKLSAEGVEEVVRAMQQVQKAASNVGSAKKDVGLLGKAFEDLKDVLPTIGLALAAEKMGELVVHALESADAIGKLSQKTGVSTETLSVLSYAAKLADADFQQLGKGLEKFNKTMGELDQGSSTAASAVRRLFGSSQALNGLNTEQRLTKTIDALGKMEAGYQKTKTAQDFFGKSGAELIPLFDSLADGGMEKARLKAQALGLIIDEDLAKSAERANDAMKTLELQAQGLATQFASGLAPAIANAAEAFTEATTSGQKGMNGMQLVGKGLGKVIEGITAAFIVVGKTIGTVVALGLEQFDALRQGAGLLFDYIKTGGAFKPGNTEKLGASLTKLGQGSADRQSAIVDSYGDDLYKTLDKLFNGDATVEGISKKAGGGKGQATLVPDSATAQALAARLLAQLSNEQSIFKLQQEILATQQKADYDKGLIDLQTYYDDRRKTIEAESDKQIEALKKQRAQLAATSLGIAGQESDDQIQAKKIKRMQDLDNFDAKIKEAQLQRTIDLNKVEDERTNAEFKLQQARQDAEKQIQALQGKTYDAAIANIQKEYEARKKAGLDDLTNANLAAVQTKQAGYQEFQRQGSQGDAQLGLQKARIDNSLAGGDLFPFEAVQKYDEAVKKLIPDLMAAAEAQLANAQTPEERASAEQRIEQLKALGIQADQTKIQMANFKAGVQSALQSNLANFFTKGIEEAHNFGDAMRGLALSVVDSLRQMAAQMLATYATQQLLKLAGGAFGGGGGGTVGAAEGGYISGPGTSTSDSIPARLSNGEFVVRASAVSQPGVLPLLAHLNKGVGTPTLASRGVPRFADGGLVDAAGIGGGGGIGELHLGIEEGIIVKRVMGALKTKEAGRIQIQQMRQNQKSAKSALGGN